MATSASAWEVVHRRKSDDAPRAPRGGVRELEIGLPGGAGAPCSTVSASTADHRLPTQTPWARSLVAACFAWVPGPQVRDRRRQVEPSLPIRPWPAGVPVAPGGLLRSLADKSARPSVAECARRPVCAVDAPLSETRCEGMVVRPRHHAAVEPMASAAAAQLGRWRTETVYATTDLPAHQARPDELAAWIRTANSLGGAEPDDRVVAGSEGVHPIGDGGCLSRGPGWRG